MSTEKRRALGQMIRTARQERGLSTTELAKTVGMAQSNLVRLEKGEVQRPLPANLERLAEQLGLPLAELYDLAGFPLPQVPLQPYLRAGYGLSDDDIGRVHDYIQQLAAKHGGTGDGPADGADELTGDTH